MSSSNRARLTRCDTRESTFGTPVSAAHTVVRRTGGTGGMTVQTGESDAVRDDLMNDDVYRSDRSASLSIDGELVYGVYDKMFEDVMKSAWVDVTPITGTTIAFVNSTSKITDSGNGFGSLAVGDWIIVSGAGTAGNNQFYRITTKTSAGDITVSPAPTDESASASITITTSRLVNGTTNHIVTFEEYYADLTTPKYIVYSGMQGTGFKITGQHPGKYGINFTYVGKSASDPSSSTVGNGTVNAYAANPVMNTADNIFDVQLDRAAGTGLRIKNRSLEFMSPVLPLTAEGTLGPVEAGSLSSMSLKGMYEFYNNNAFLTKLANANAFAESSQSFRLTDSLGNDYIFDVASLFYVDDNQPKQGGKNQHSMATMNWIGRRYSTYNRMLGIFRFPTS